MDMRRTVEGIVWRFRTGAPWRDVPEGFRNGHSVYGRFADWSKDGTWLAGESKSRYPSGRTRSQDGPGAVPKAEAPDPSTRKATKAEISKWESPRPVVSSRWSYSIRHLNFASRTRVLSFVAAFRGALSTISRAWDHRTYRSACREPAGSMDGLVGVRRDYSPRKPHRYRRDNDVECSPISTGETRFRTTHLDRFAWVQDSVRIQRILDDAMHVHRDLTQLGE